MQVVIFSGGLDSSTLLAYVLAEHPRNNVLALTFGYGQTHTKEVIAAKELADYFGVAWKYMTIPDVFPESALLGDRQMPRGEYNETNMADTVVHGRNLLFASYGVALAGEDGTVWVGVHSGNHHLYGDCRPSFWVPFRDAVMEAYNVKVSTPFLTLSKTEIVDKGLSLGVPYELTWSCYAGGKEPCGECGTCKERKAAFVELGELDPLLEAV